MVLKKAENAAAGYLSEAHSYPSRLTSDKSRNAPYDHLLRYRLEKGDETSEWSAYRAWNGRCN